MTKIREHFYAVIKHWVLLMSGIASLAVSLLQRFRGGIGVPDWAFLLISAACFFAAFHLAWLDKDKELKAVLGSAPEVVMEWQYGKRNPLMLRNLRGSTAYHLQVKEVVIGDRCTAKFDEVSFLAAGASIGVLPVVNDTFKKPNTDEGKTISSDFTHVLEAAYETWGRKFDPLNLPLFVSYEDRNKRKYAAHCNIVFDRLNATAKMTCEPSETAQQGNGNPRGQPADRRGSDPLQWELYNDHKKQAWQDIQSSTDSFDQNMLTLSSAALGLSLAFIKDIVPLEKAVWLWLLFASWISFSGCILTTVASFQVSIAAQNQYLEYLWHYYIRRDEEYFNRQKESRPSKALTLMTWLAAAFFIVGLASTLIFCSKNVARRSTMTESKSVRLVEGRAPVNMTPAPAPDQRGRQPVEMTPVPSQTQKPAAPTATSGNDQKK